MLRATHPSIFGCCVLVVHCATAQQAQPLPLDSFGEDEGTTELSSPQDFQPISPAEEIKPYVARWETPDRDWPILPVFQGKVSVRREMLALIGGFDSNLRTTPVVQLLHPTRGWLPIGSQMIDARAGHTQTELQDGRLLIVGGMSGEIGAELTPLATCEVLDPLRAGSTEVESLDEALTGHTAHPIGQGRVVVIGGSAAHVFDGETLSWIGRIPLARARRSHASVVLRDGSVLVIGGDETGTVETVALSDQSDAVGVQWLQTLGTSITECAAVLLDDGRVLVAGGIDQATGLSIDRTWLLDPTSRSVSAGPRLQIEGGVAGLHVWHDNGQVVLVGGEHVTPADRQPTNVARMYQPESDRLWSLPAIPNRASRRNWYVTADGRLAALGGFFFAVDGEADQEGARPGTNVLGDSVTLRIGQLPRMLD